MPEYLAPGVFVEEVSFRAKSIEGVSTTTTGFVGATRYGPVDIEPDILTSLVEYERVYGGKQRMDFDDVSLTDNYMWNAVRAFFEEGGKRCYVARAFDFGYLAADTDDQKKTKRDAKHAKVSAPYPPANVTIRARFPGKAGEARVRLQMTLSQNRFSTDGTTARLSASSNRDVVMVTGLATASNDGLFLLSRDVQKDIWTFDNGVAGGGNVKFELQDQAARTGLAVKTLAASVFVDPTDDGLPFFAAAGLALDRAHTTGGEPDSVFDYFAAAPASMSRARTIPIVIEQMTKADADKAKTAADTAFNTAKTDASTKTTDANTAKTNADKAKADADKAEADAVAAEADAAANPADAPKQAAALAARALVEPANKKRDEEAEKSALAATARDTAITKREAAKLVAEGAASTAIAAAGGALDGLEYAKSYLVAGPADGRFTLKTLKGLNEDDTPRDADLPILDTAYFLTSGSDGNEPGLAAYEGAEDPNTNASWGLKAFESIEDISIVAAPGSTANETDARAIAGALISHAERMRYQIAVLDSVFGHSISEVRDYRGKLDSKYAAFYYPWVKVIDPLTGQENHYPPSGFVAGIYARNDIERAVYKAPANEIVRLAVGFEKLINKGQQEVLNPEGINCFRYFEGRGNRLWGARTISSDPEWKYVNLRRYFAYLERSIDKSTQWAVFEPNGELLWANVRSTIQDFLLNEWTNGALLGDKPEKSFFVKCDRSTMTQNDLDNGRLVCLVGVAPLRPAEFVIFRIGQWTADRKI